ncbi:MAG TPA: TlpA disulfide reductase family protein [Pyrinomonadaceae bacterium]|nr:TlpA disulfide reductase family protein [Pyrinomonadaceae bacterium]
MKSFFLLFVLFLTTLIVAVAQTNTINVPLKLINVSLGGVRQTIAELKFDQQQIITKTPSNLSVKIERFANSKDIFSITPDKNNDGVFTNDETINLDIGSKQSFTQLIKDKFGKSRNVEFDIRVEREESKKIDYFTIHSDYSAKGQFEAKNCSIPIYVFDHNANTLFENEENASNIGIDRNNDGKIWGKGEWAYSTEILELCGKNFLIFNLAQNGTSLRLQQTKLQNVKLFGESPKFDFTLVNNKSLSTETLKGKPYLVDFWATWCGICIAKMPEVKQLEGILPIIYFNTDTTKRKLDALKLIDKLSIKENSVLRISPNADNFYKSYQRLESGLPFYVLIDGNGIIRYGGNGGENLKEVKDKIAELNKSR